MGDSEPEDVAAEEEEENFEEGMQRRAQDYELADADQDNKLDFDEFCNMVKSREEGAENYTEEQLKERFDALDADGSGKVDMSEYLRFSCSARRSSALRRSRVVDLFRQWDEDDSGTIDKKEFRRAIQALGFDFFDEVSEIDKVFDEFDVDKSGSIEYKELNKMLRQQAKIADNLQPGAAGKVPRAVEEQVQAEKGQAEGRQGLASGGQAQGQLEPERS